MDDLGMVMRFIKAQITKRASRPNKGSKQTRIELFRASGFFDSAWYQSRYPDVRRMDPLDHFVQYGSTELRDPGPRFSAKWYHERYADARASGLDPLSHFLVIGQAQGRAISAPASNKRWGDPDRSVASFDERAALVLSSGLFDPAWYVQQHRDVGLLGLDPLTHFVQYGGAELRDPGPDFEAKWYFKEYKDVRESGLDPLLHFLKIGKSKGYLAKGPPAYVRWRREFDDIDAADRVEIANHINASDLRRVTVLYLFDELNLRHLEEVAGHLSGQLYTEWRAVLHCDGTCSPAMLSTAHDAMSAGDARIRFLDELQQHEFISSLSNDLVLFVQGSSVFREHALYMFAAAAEDVGPSDALFYADHDIADTGGQLVPRFKPAYSPILFSQQDYHEGCFMLRGDSPLCSELVRQLTRQCSTRVSGLFRQAASRLTTGVHIPFVLSRELQQPAEAASAPPLTIAKTAKEISTEDLPTVSIIIATKDRVDLLQPCLSGLQDKTSYPRHKMQIVVVDNGSEEAETLSFLAALEARHEIKLVRHSDLFNFSRLNNLGVLNSDGEVLVFLNNDVEFPQPDWLLRLIPFCLRPEIAAVGAKLIYPDRTVQHGGIVLGIHGVAAHSNVGVPEAASGYGGLNRVTREVAAVTGACLAMRRMLFQQLGGLDPDLAVAFNDVALCLQALRSGYRNVWVHDCVLLHHESKSRGYDTTQEKKRRLLEEARLVRLRYGMDFNCDPFYSPNLSLETIYEPAFPPRVVKPWQSHSRHTRRPKVLMLSSVHKRGYEFPVITKIQAEYFAHNGIDVVIGGPESDCDLAYLDCTRVALDTPEEAAIYAVKNQVDCIVVHTPPFFAVVGFFDSSFPIIFYDYGEAPADLFPDSEARKELLLDKRFCSASATRLIAISEAVREEANEPRMDVIPLGNTHLAKWDEQSAARRLHSRAARNWQAKTVVLNACRFRRTERFYKGIDRFLDVAATVKLLEPRSDIAFVLCGRADDEDAEEIRAFGVEVYTNVSDEELMDLYCAADLYANFSRWEGYNPGIAQAVAMGLPVVASDIPAHRAFNVTISNDRAVLARAIIQSNRRGSAQPRKPRKTEWDASLRQFRDLVLESIPAKRDWVRVSSISLDLP